MQKEVLISQGLSSLSQILEYGQKLKELDIKRMDIEKKYKSMDNAINSIKEIEIKEIEEQSKRLKEILKTTLNQIKNNRLERKDIIKEISLLNKKALDPKNSLDDKKMCLDLIKMQSEILKDIGENGIRTLHELAQTTQKAITASNEKRSKFNIPATLSYIEN
jgi:hypothetical protein